MNTQKDLATDRSWMGKTIVGPELTGDEEVEARYRVRYRGQAPKRRIPGNMNYYDHNILGLRNRTPMSKLADHDTPVFESVDALKRSRSQPRVG